MLELIKFVTDCIPSVNLDRVIADGKLHRFSLDRNDTKESGYYIFFQNYSNKTGAQYYAGLVGDWRTGESFHYMSSIPFTAEDRKLAQKKIEDAQRKAEQEKRIRNEQAALEVAEKWPTYKEGLSEYHRAKGLGQSFGARIQESFYGVSAVVPMVDVDGKLWNVQKIQANRDKFFYPGGRVQGCFHVIGPGLEESETIYIAEGFATAGTIHEATGGTVVCAFTAGNVLAVAVELKRRFSSKAFIICGDEDVWSERGNAGRTKAEEAAKQVMGVAVMPRFKSMDGKPTDFNDLYLREGMDAVRDQLGVARPKRVSVSALGYRPGEYYFTSSENPNLCVLTSFTDTQLLDLIDKEYWEIQYPKKNGGVDWTAAKSDMMARARQKGPFDASRVRGSGVWLDAGRVVVNLGNRLSVDGREIALREFRSKFFYSPGKAIPPIHAEPLSLADCQELIKTLELFKWQKKDNSKLLAGYLVVSRVCGSLPIRPHVWLTGGSHTGKSTLLQRVIHPFLKDFCLYLYGPSTEAGIRQAMRADSIPIIFDEFETTTKKTSENVQACLELMRAAWAESSGSIVKGSATGAAEFYHARFSAVVSSIRTALTNDADRSRFTTLELAPHGNDLEHWANLSKRLQMFTDEFSSRLMARTINRLPDVLENYRRFKRALAVRVNQRDGDQRGMLLAGYGLLMSDQALTDDEVEIVVNGLESEEAGMVDHEECWNYLLTKKITIEIDGARGDRTISECIEMSRDSREPIAAEKAERALQRYGISVESKTVYVASSHTELRILFRDTRWLECWSSTLSRLPGASKSARKYFAGSRQRAIAVPLS